MFFCLLLVFYCISVVVQCKGREIILIPQINLIFFYEKIIIFVYVIDK